MEHPFSVLSLQPKDCSSCKKKDAIPPGDWRITCFRCREQRRKSNERKRISKREKAALLLSSDRDEKDGATSLGDTNLVPKKKERKLAIGVGPPDLPSPKKKKKHLSRKTWTEYQTSDGLYEALGDKVASGSMPEFRGRFSIVMDLNISHLKRAKTVAKELKTIVKYPIRSGSRSISDVDSSAEIKYSCACLANTDQPSSSSSKPHAAPLQNSHSSNGILRADEKVQANGTKLAEALQASFTRDCKGSVRITVETDSSHPVGVLGQRISIVVKH